MIKISQLLFDIEFEEQLYTVIASFNISLTQFTVKKIVKIIFLKEYGMLLL